MKSKFTFESSEDESNNNESLRFTIPRSPNNANLIAQQYRNTCEKSVAMLEELKVLKEKTRFNFESFGSFDNDEHEIEVVP